MPLLSIILPNYNHAHFLPMALESILTQSFFDLEVIVVDDGSTDDSVSLIESYAQSDPRIRLFRHEQNRGIADAFETALMHCRGIYLLQFSASDYLVAGYLEKALSLLQQHPQFGLCCGDTGLFDGDPAHYSPCPLLPGGTKAPKTLLFPPTTIAQVYKYARLNIPGLTTIVKCDSFVKYGGYQRRLHFMCDWLINHQIALFEGAIYIPETLTLFRKPGYTVLSSQNPQIRKEALDTLIATLLKNPELLIKMKQAATLGLLAKERFWQCLRHPRLCALYPPLLQRFLYTQWRRLLHQPQVSSSFLVAKASIWSSLQS